MLPVPGWWEFTLNFRYASECDVCHTTEKLSGCVAECRVRFLADYRHGKSRSDSGPPCSGLVFRSALQDLPMDMIGKGWSTAGPVHRGYRCAASPSVNCLLLSASRPQFAADQQHWLLAAGKDLGCRCDHRFQRLGAA
jgi:hypothetical protein